MKRSLSILNSGLFITLLTGAITILVAVYQWSSTEKSKLLDFEKQRKEASYKSLVYALRGFYPETEECLSETEINKLRYDFSIQMDYCMLYCSDEVVRRTSELVRLVSANASKAKQTDARNSLMVAIRREFQQDSSFKSLEYIALNPIKPGTKCDFYLHNNQIQPIPNGNAAD